MKKINLYDSASLKRLEASYNAALASARKVMAKDSAYSGIVLERDLVQVDPRVLERRSPELAFMNSGIQADNTGGYAQQIQTKRIQELGDFTKSSDISQPKGKISIAAEQGTLNVSEYEAGSDWTDTDVRQAAMGNINLMDSLLSAANKVYMRKIDTAGLIGLDGNEGLLNNSLFTSEASSVDSTSATGEQMYGEVAELITDQWNGAVNIPEFMADRVILPISVMNRLNSTLLKSESGSKTVLAAIQENFRTVTFLSSHRAESVSATRVMVAFSSNSEGLIFRLPLPLQIGEVVKLGSFNFHVDYKFRLGGLDVLEPAACRLMTGF